MAGAMRMENEGDVQSALVAFERVDLDVSEVRDQILNISMAYFKWMNDEIVACCKFSIPDIVGMSLETYVFHTTEIGRRIGSAEGGVYVRRDDAGQIMAMGGIRRLPDGAAEIVRIFTRPQFRGRGLGAQSVDHLIGEARRLGYGMIRLDTGVFMRSAQKIYHAAGFQLCEPYPGAEPPEQLLPYWLYLELSL